MCVKCVNGYCSEYDLFIRKTFLHTKTVESDYRKTDGIDVMPNQGRILINTMSFYLVFLTDYKTTRPSQFINEINITIRIKDGNLLVSKKCFCLWTDRPLADLLTFPRSDENVKAKDNIASEQTHKHGLFSKTHCVTLCFNIRRWLKRVIILCIRSAWANVKKTGVCCLFN